MNCKPGDLAYIVASEDPSQIGIVVEVLRMEYPQHEMWLIKVRDGHACVLTGLPLQGTAMIKDSCLRPISGVPVTDDIADEVTA